MPSIIEISKSKHDDLVRKSEISDSFVVLMSEAADCSSSTEAAKVISSVLNNLVSDYPELKDLARSWCCLARFESNKANTA